MQGLGDKGDGEVGCTVSEEMTSSIFTYTAYMSPGPGVVQVINRGSLHPI